MKEKEKEDIVVVLWPLRHVHRHPQAPACMCTYKVQIESALISTPIFFSASKTLLDDLSPSSPIYRMLQEIQEGDFKFVLRTVSKLLLLLLLLVL